MYLSLSLYIYIYIYIYTQGGTCYRGLVGRLAGSPGCASSCTLSVIAASLDYPHPTRSRCHPVRPRTRRRVSLRGRSSAASRTGVNLVPLVPCCTMLRGNPLPSVRVAHLRFPLAIRIRCIMSVKNEQQARLPGSFCWRRAARVASNPRTSRDGPVWNAPQRPISGLGPSNRNMDHRVHLPR